MNPVSLTEIRRRLPQKGAMCLIDGVTSWDGERIACCAYHMRKADNPLRRAGQLSVVHSIEFGAQAATLHWGLVHSEADAPRRGLLVQVRRAAFHVERLDLVAEPLEIASVCLMWGTEAVRYGYSIRSASVPVAEGELTVMFRSA